MRERLPLVLSVTALVVAVFGSTSVGEAARNLVVPRASVGTPQLKNNAVTTAKVRNFSLTAADFKRGQAPRGPVGPQGPQGPPGMAALQAVFTTGASNSVRYKTLTAACPAGKLAVSGGGAILPAGANTAVAITRSYQANATTWEIAARETSTFAPSWSINAVVMCATVAQ